MKPVLAAVTCAWLALMLEISCTDLIPRGALFLPVVCAVLTWQPGVRLLLAGGLLLLLDWIARPTLLPAVPLLLPFGLLETLGVATIFVVAAMAFVFLVVETVGGLLQDPFTRGAYGLPLSAMSRTIEIDLRSALGERDLPAPLAPVELGNGLQNLL